MGRHSDDPSGDSKHSGKITDVNIWNRALSLDSMARWTNCSLNLSGDLVDWNTAEWEVIGMDEYEINLSTVCQSNDLGLGIVLVPGNWNITMATNLCMALKGQINVISTKTNNDQIKSLMESSKKCGSVWTGWWDEDIEGHMKSITSGNSLTNQQFAPWEIGEPNGDVMENCGILNQHSAEWNDIDCSSEYCVACQIPSTPIFVLRGKESLKFLFLFNRGTI